MSKERPHLLQDKHLFGGLITIKAYDYWWGYSAAQIQLMVVDAPLIVYTHGKDRKPSKREIEEKFEEWKGKNSGGKISIDKILNG